MLRLRNKWPSLSAPLPHPFLRYLNCFAFNTKSSHSPTLPCRQANLITSVAYSSSNTVPLALAISSLCHAQPLPGSKFLIVFHLKAPPSGIPYLHIYVNLHHLHPAMVSVSLLSLANNSWHSSKRICSINPSHLALNRQSPVFHAAIAKEDGKSCDRNHLNFFSYLLWFHFIFFIWSQNPY